MLRSIILLILPALALGGLQAQASDLAQRAINQLKADKERLGLSAVDVADLRLKEQYASANGTEHLIIQQYQEGIPVYNGQAGLHYFQDELVHQTSNLVSGFSSQSISTSAGISAEIALLAAAEEVGFIPQTGPERIGGSSQVVTFQWPEVAHSPINVQLNFYQTPTGRIQLAWRLELDQVNTPDYWELQLDAVAGRLLAQNNYTLYCDFGKHNHRHSTGEACNGHFSARPVAQPIAESTETSTLADGATYRVFPFRVESPIYGERELLTNPADPIASPFGWHDTNGSDGPEFTITRGNNVYAYNDIAADNSPSAMDAVEGGEDLVFDFPFSLEVQPENQVDASVTQLFYMNNIMHDLTYHHGFDEPAGNFQSNTYDNGGAGGDPVRGEAQDGTDTNNANFATPPDGNPPRMQMYIWEGGEENLLNIESPANIAGPYVGVDAAFGPDITTDTLRGNIVEAFDESTQPALCCEPIVNATEVFGNIALITRGECFFEQKVLNAEIAGAIAVIICNGQSSSPSQMGATNEVPDPTIPSVMIPDSDCEGIRVALAAGETVTVNLVRPDVSVARDSDFDNGIIAHEYGHGISNRTVGGPGNTSCLFNQEQMGEGWSDYFSLVTSPQASLDGAEPRGIGNYARGSGPQGAGIRQKRYSTDFGVNDYSYDDIIATGNLNDDDIYVVRPHALGEIWATTLWDMYWAFVDMYGFDEDLIQGNGGNNMAVELVIEGMKFTACTPGLIDGRDGILAADAVLHDGAHECMLWEIFSRRGLGYLADQGGDNAFQDNEENFETLPSCIPTIKVVKSSNRERIDAGEEVNFLLTVVSHKPETVTGVQIVDELPAGMTLIPSSVVGVDDFEVVGNTIVFSLDDLDFEDEAEIGYRVTTDETLGSTTYFFDDVENGDDDWDIIPLDLDGDFFWNITTDNVYEGNLAFFVENSEFENDQTIQPIDPILIQGDQPALRFYTAYDTEAAWDGGIVEVSADGGNSWDRVADKFMRNGYRGVIQESTFDEEGVEAYWGNSNGYSEQILDLSDYSGQEVLVRWRFKSDGSYGVTGWWIDNIEQLDLFNYDGEACLTTAEGDNVCARVPNAGVVVGPGLDTSTEDPVLGETKLMVFPNPADDHFQLVIQSERAGPLRLELLSIDGRSLSRQNVQLIPGGQQARFDTEGFPAGVYLLRAAGVNELQTLKVTIK